ncbi:MAG TPA: GreA/GreB family elongation factor [bacterium]|nr:GreA/GreB family elongation factor [bacterium]
MRLPTRKAEKERIQRQEIDNYLTPAKITAMERELENLKKSQRGPAAEEVARLAQMGDLSENAGYQFAKQNLRRINDRITILEERLKHAIPIDQSRSDGKVRIGSTVTVTNQGKTTVFEILGSVESNPFKGKISYSSPLGASLIGHGAGETVEVTINDQKFLYTIEKVS